MGAELASGVSGRQLQEYLFAMFDFSGEEAVQWSAFYHTLKNPGVQPWAYRLTFLLLSADENAMTKKEFLGAVEKVQALKIQDLRMLTER